MQEAIEFKPGMGLEKFRAPTPPSGGDLPGIASRGPAAKDAAFFDALTKENLERPAYRHLGVQITAGLYAKVVETAKAEGSGTSVFVRRILANHLGEAAPLDRLDGVRVPPAELAAASVMLGHLTQLVIASRDMADGQAAGAVAAMEAIHTRLVRIIEKLEG